MDEYISRDDTKNALLNKGQHTTRYRLGETWELNFMEILEALDAIPAADVQPVKRGRWEYYKNNGIIDTYICTNCQSKVEMTIDVEPSKFKYCPNCGAKMDGDKE